MKKLMIAAAIVCAAAYVQAGSIKWSSTKVGSDAGTGELYLSDGVTKVSSGTGVYLFNVATLSQDSLVSGLRDAEDAASYWAGLATGSILDQTTVNASSKIATKQSGNLAESGSTIAVYYAALVGDEVLISTQMDNVVVPSGDVSANVQVKWNEAGSTFSKVNKGSADYTAAGWYSVVPEPTSGLLLLLGVAGLALRRRRA